MPDTFLNYLMDAFPGFISTTIGITVVPILYRAFKIFKESRKEKSKKGEKTSSFIHFINRYFPTWQNLKVVANNRIFRTSYLWFAIVPLVAKLLSKTEKGVIFTLQAFPNINISLGVPFSWNLFYFGSLSFVLAGIIYSWKAPGLIKKHNDYKEFFDKENSGVAIINEVEKSLETNDEKENYLIYLYYHFDWRPNIDPPTLEEKVGLRIKSMMQLENREMANLYALSVHHLDGKFIIYRVLTTFFYYLSFSFYGYVILEQSYFVISEFISHNI